MTDNKNKLCLILEGGGSKCAYQDSCIAVLEKAGYKFDAIAGASFGAFNGALYLSGKAKKLNSFWNNVSCETIFGDEKIEEVFTNISNGKEPFDEDLKTYFTKKWSDFNQKHNEITMAYFRTIIENVDEDAIRNSDIDFALNTIKLPLFTDESTIFDNNLDLFSKFDLFFDPVKTGNKILNENINTLLSFDKTEIPNGKLPEFVVASSTIPPLKPIKIFDKHYIDGGLIDNVPLRMMINKGYRNFIVIRTNPGILDLYDVKELDEISVKYIIPKESLGSIANFSRNNIDKIREIGYNDVLDFIEKDTNQYSKWLRIKKKLTKDEILK